MATAQVCKPPAATCVTPPVRVLTAVGEVHGEILTAPRGAGGFGYDPLFYYPPLGKSFAELPREEKFAVSHRGHAVRNLVKKL